MTQSQQDWLDGMAVLVARQHELVPFFGEMHVPQDMAFRPMPPEMLEVIRALPDFSEPEAGVPTLLTFETENQSGGLMVVRDHESDDMLVLVPSHASGRRTD